MSSTYLGSFLFCFKRWVKFDCVNLYSKVRVTTQIGATEPYFYYSIVYFIRF